MRLCVNRGRFGLVKMGGRISLQPALKGLSVYKKTYLLKKHALMMKLKVFAEHLLALFFSLNIFGLFNLTKSSLI